MDSWRPKLRPLDEMAYILIGALALLLGVGAVYLNWQKAQQANLLALQSRSAVAQMRQLQLTVAEAESGQRGFLLTGEESYLEPFTRAMQQLDPQMAQLRETGATVQPIGLRFGEMQRLVNDKVAELRASVQAGWFGEWETANAMVAAGEQMRSSRKLRQTLAEVELATLQEGEQLAEETRDKMRQAALLAVFCCVALFILFAVENHRAGNRRRAAEYASEVKSSFLASMSHELRTPLNAVIGYSQMLQEDAEEEGRKSQLQDLQKIETAGKHLLELINSILEMSKIEAGKVEVHATAFAVPELLEEVFQLVQPMAAKNGNQLELAVAPGVTRMFSDPMKLRQCLLNLLSNAAKFTQGGRITLRVERMMEGNRPFLRFAVIDTGAGIPPAELARLFESFHQLESVPVRAKGQGTGLGLAITRRLSRMLGGDTLVESEPGAGSTFTLALPEELTPGALATVKRPFDPEQPSILVIDDDAAIHGLVRRVFDKQPLQVVVARNGEEGLRLARELRPRVITLDLVMEGVDGWDVLRRLKSDADVAEIPVILLSVLDAQDDPRARQAAEVLTKPVDVERLTSTILRHAGQAHSRNALIVEDSAETRDFLRRPLEKLGWTVVEAANGAQGMEQFHTTQPGLVLLDLMMPEVDGFEFLNRLRAHQQGQGTPVIVVTAMDLSSAQRDLLRQLKAAVLMKSALSSQGLMAQVLAMGKAF